eukprot:4984798-Ditylum_brightwellii.AAC.1
MVTCALSLIPRVNGDIFSSITGDNTAHYCDNSTLCNRIQAMQQDQTITPTHKIQSNLDVHMDIDETV